MEYNKILAVLAWYSMLPSLVLSSSNQPPRVSIQQLKHSGINLHKLLFDSRGIIRIAVGGDDDGGHDVSAVRKRALSHLCDCPTFRSSKSSTSLAPEGVTNRGAIAFEEALKFHPKDLQQITLPDGTVRRTLASATIVHSGHDENGVEEGSEQHLAAAIQLPGWVQDNCGRDAYDSFEDLRDVVAEAVDIFVEKLDQEDKISKQTRSYEQILSSADHLEHFHVYTKSNTSPLQDGNNEGGLWDTGKVLARDEERGGQSMSKEESSTLDYHTDAGFFLSFVPAMNCHSYSTDTSSFFLEGEKNPAAFEEDEVVIMLGAGAQHWLPPREQSDDTMDNLQKQYPFQAASHALRLSPDTHRAWYGKMHLLPSSFTASNVDPQSPASVKFGEVFPSFQMNDYNAHVPMSPVDGCGTSALNENSLSRLSLDTKLQKQTGRRRLQHVNSPTSCNNQTNFFCWYQCMDIPSSDQAEQYVQGGYSLYCLDPGKLSSTDNSIADAAAPCKNGYVHNSNCIGSWQETDENTPGYKLPYEVEEKEQSSAASTFPMPEIYTGDKYCYGGTSMYMEGFTWQGTTCVIYLFQSWVLSTPGKFAAAAIGSILFGVLLEFVLWKRKTVYALDPGVQRLCLSALVYGIQLSMGYFIMLVVMTYSVPLFMSTIGGMMLGHICFNAQDSLVKKRAESTSSSVQKDELPDRGSNTELNSYQNGDEHLEGGERLKFAQEGKVPVPDGATPCCQYTL